MFQGGKALDPRPDQRARFRHRAVGQARHRHADRDHPLGAAAAQQRQGPDYGVPPLNGFPLNVPRNTAYGFADDYTEQDVILLSVDDRAQVRQGPDAAQPDGSSTGSTPTVRETSRRASSARWRPTAPSCRPSHGPNGTPYSVAPLNQLYVRQLSHDRNINDISVENQTELTGQVRHRPDRARCCWWASSSATRATTNKNYTRNGICNGVALQPAATRLGCTSLGFTVGGGIAGQRAGRCRATTPRRRRLGRRLLHQRHDQVIPELKLVGGVRYDIYWAQIGNSINSVNTPGNTTLAYPTQTDYFTSVRGGADLRADARAVLLRLVQHLVQSVARAAHLDDRHHAAAAAGEQRRPSRSASSTTAERQPVADRRGVPDHQEQRAHAESPTAPSPPTGTVRVKGVRIGIAGRITPEWQVFGGYAYLDARIINGSPSRLGNTTGMVPLNTPRDSATLWTTYTFDETYEIGGGVIYLGQRYANNPNTVQVPAYHALRRDGGLQAADLRRAPQHLQPAQRPRTTTRSSRRTAAAPCRARADGAC